MPMKCSACIHDKRGEIDSAIVAGTPLRKIAGSYGLSTTALFRHKSHIGKSMVQAAQRREELLGDTLLSDMKSLRERTLNLLDQAEQSGNAAAQTALIREARANVSALSDLLEKANAGSQDEQTGTALAGTIIHIGEAPVHEWFELSEKYTKLLPDLPPGTRVYAVYPAPPPPRPGDQPPLEAHVERYKEYEDAPDEPSPMRPVEHITEW